MRNLRTSETIKKRVGLLLLALLCLQACKPLDPGPEKQIRLKSYQLMFDDSKELNVFWVTYSYDQERISKIAFNDTTYYKATKQFEPKESVFLYTYDEEGFLIKRTSSVTSLFQNSKTEVAYQYENGRLDLENFGNRVTEYRYDEKGNVKETISTSLINGSKSFLKYNNNVPEELVQQGEVFLREDANEKIYYDSNLLELKYESYRNGALYFERSKTYAPPKLHLNALPNFKGFPTIKSFSYRNGIEKSTYSFIYENGQKKPVYTRALTQTYNPEGFLIRNRGEEILDQNSDSPTTRKLDFIYNYEYF